jgi:hypothetical protein
MPRKRTDLGRGRYWLPNERSSEKEKINEFVAKF